MAHHLERSIASLIDSHRRLLWALEGIVDDALLTEAKDRLKGADQSLMSAAREWSNER